MSETVKVTIDDREVEVERGKGLIETAEAAGIEIPVFCYEPRLGPPVGAWPAAGSTSTSTPSRSSGAR